MSFESCLSLLSLKEKLPVDEIRDTAKEYEAEGVDPAAAMERAVSEHLMEAKRQEAQIVATVREKFVAGGGKLPERAAAPVGQDEGVRYSVDDEHSPIFYSALERTVPDMAKVAGKDGTIKPEQALAWLAARQKEGKFKADELQWVGVEEWLKAQPGRVAVADIQNFVRENGVQVQEVQKGDAEEAISERLDFDEAKRSALAGEYITNQWGGRIGADRAHLMAPGDVYYRTTGGKAAETKYGQYVLPGGENYREMLLTLPTEAPNRTRKLREEIVAIQEHGMDEGRDLTPGEVARMAKLREQLAQAAGRTPAGAYSSTHWDEKNIVAHVRFNDRTDADGKRVLFIEELQSDWGQDGLKKGFREQKERDLEDLIARRDSLTDQVEIDRVQQQINRLGGGNPGVPEGPFVGDTKAWLSLGIKRMVRYAAENGYDRVAFVNGRQSAERYDLSKQIDGVQWKALKDAPMGQLIAWKDGREVIKQQMAPEKLEDHVGKEVAKKLLESAPATTTDGMEVRKLEGLDLQVGGEGMKTFYDKIVPQTINDVLRKLGGGKLTESRLVVDDRLMRGFDYTGPTKTADELTAFLRENKRLTVSVEHQISDVRNAMLDGMPFKQAMEERASPAVAEALGGRLDDKEAVPQGHIAFDITDALREKALGGLPLFSAAKHPLAQEAMRAVDPLVQALADQGAIVLHKDASTLPVRGKIPAGVQALTTRDGTIHVVANALGGNGRGIVLHEAFHAGGEALIGSKEWGGLMDRLQTLHDRAAQDGGRTGEFWDAARARVEAAKAKGAVGKGMEAEEFGAYAIEEYAKAPASIRKWVDDLVGAVKSWVLARFGYQLGDVTPAQLMALSKLALLDARAGRAAEMSPAFSSHGGDPVSTAKTGKPWAGEVYHGTAGAEFDTFRPRTARAVWFAPDSNYAKKYADSRQGENRRVLTARVRLDNPLVIDMKGEQDLPKKGRQGAMKYANTIEDAVGVAQQWGHDGVIFKNRKLTDEGFSSEEVAVFDPAKIEMIPTIKDSLQVDKDDLTGDRFSTDRRADPRGTDRRIHTVQVDGERRPIEDSQGRQIGKSLSEQVAFWRNYTGPVDEHGRPIRDDDATDARYSVAAAEPEAITEQHRSALSKIIGVPKELLKSAAHNTRMLVMPITAGAEHAMAWAKDYANNNRAAERQWAAFDKVLKASYSEDQLKKMWIAADQENDLRREGRTSTTKGLANLNAGERRTVELLHAYGEQLWDRAKRAGLVQESSEGVHYWTPRMAARMVADGAAEAIRGPAGEFSKEARNLKTTASSLKQRMHETTAESEAALKAKLGDDAEYVKNIRVMPMAMAQLEKAIAGRTLVNQIRAHGVVAGAELVSDVGGPNFVTFDHPALKKMVPRTKFENGEAVIVKDEDGNPVMDRVPLFIRKDFAGPLKAVFTTDAGAAYRAFMELKGMSMNLIMFSPAMHAAVIYGKAAPSLTVAMGWKNNLKNIGTAGIYSLRLGNKIRQDHAEMQRLVEGGLVPMGGRGMNPDLPAIADGIKPGRSLVAKAIGSVFDLAGKKAGDGARKAVDAAGHFWHETLLWDRIGDLQAGMAVQMRNNFMNHGVDEYTATRIATHFANRYAGAVPREALSQAANAVMNVTLFSKSFTLTNVGAMKDPFVGLPKEIRAQIRLHAAEMQKALGKTDIEARDAADKVVHQAQSVTRNKAAAILLVDFAAMAAITSLAQAYFAGQNGQQFLDDLKERYKALKIKIQEDNEEAANMPFMEGMMKRMSSALHPFDALEKLSQTSDNPHGKESRVRLNEDGSGNSYYMRLPFGKVVEEMMSYTNFDTATTLLKNKLSPLVGSGVEALKNEDFQGRRIYKPQDNLMKQIGAVAGHILKAQVPFDDAVALKHIMQGDTDQGGKIHLFGRDWNMDEAKLLGGVTGLSVGKVSGGDAVAEMRYQNREQQADLRDVLPDVRDLALRGKTDEAMELLEQAGQTPKEAQRILRQIEQPGRISKQQMKKFNAHADESERERLEKMRQRAMH